MRHEAPLAIVADGAGDFAGDEGTKKLRPSNGVTRRQYCTGVDGPETDHLHVLQSDALNGIGAAYVYYLGDGRAAVGVASGRGPSPTAPRRCVRVSIA